MKMQPTQPLTKKYESARSLANASERSLACSSTPSSTRNELRDSVQPATKKKNTNIQNIIKAINIACATTAQPYTYKCTHRK